MSEIRTVKGDQLGVQALLWSAGSAQPEPEKFVPLDMATSRRWKPRGGLWTSTYDPDTIGGWAEWCRSEEFATGDHDLWLLTPEPDATLVEVDTLDDLVRLHNAYGHVRNLAPGFDEHMLDYSQIASEWTGMHLTEEGQWRTRLSHPYSLYGWDCESTWWDRWAFVKVEHAGVVTIAGDR